MGVVKEVAPATLMVLDLLVQFIKHPSCMLLALWIVYPVSFTIKDDGKDGGEGDSDGGGDGEDCGNDGGEDGGEDNGDG